MCDRITLTRILQSAHATRLQIYVTITDHYYRNLRSTTMKRRKQSDTNLYWQATVSAKTARKYESMT